MKHLKLYEDNWMDKPEIHEDDDFFDELIKQFGLSVNRDENPDSYWVHETKDVWMHMPELKINNSKCNFTIRKSSENIGKITDIIKPDRYVCWLRNPYNLLDVSQDKIKNVFDTLESKNIKYYNNKGKENKDFFKQSTFDALKEREREILNKTAKKYNL